MCVCALSDILANWQLTTEERDQTLQHDTGKRVSMSELDQLMPWFSWGIWRRHLLALPPNAHTSCSPDQDASSEVTRRNDNEDDERSQRRVDADAHGVAGRVVDLPLYLRNADFFPKLGSLLQDSSFATLQAVLVWRLLRGGEPGSKATV